MIRCHLILRVTAHRPIKSVYWAPLSEDSAQLQDFYQIIKLFHSYSQKFLHDEEFTASHSKIQSVWPFAVLNLLMLLSKNSEN